MAGCPLGACYDRFVRWRRDGTGDRLLAHLQVEADARGEIDWVVCVDGTIVRAHQHAAGARGRPSAADRAATVSHPADEALGRSRGGRTTKLHLACDGRGRALAVVLTPGPRPGGCGRPRKRPAHVVADKGYSYPTCRRLLRRRGIAYTIPERLDQRRRRAARRGRPLAFDAARYRARNYRAVLVIAALLRWMPR